MERALRHLLPRLVPDDVTVQIRVFNGKPDLLRKLPNRLAGYAHWLSATAKVLVIVDRDDDDCRRLKDAIDGMVRAAGLRVASVRDTLPGAVMYRIAVEELEAWFLGDVAALRQAYPRLPASLAQKAAYRDPDGVRGGTAETLERLLRGANYHVGGLRKIALADDVAPHMSPSENRSVSFGHFVAGLRWLTRGEAA